MHRLKKVIERPRFSTKSTASDLNISTSKRAVAVGRALGIDGAADDDYRLLGKIVEDSTGQRILDFGVWMDTSFPHVVGVFGTRGKGKSFTLGVLVENYAGQPDKATVVLDIQNQFWTLQRQPDPDLEEDERHIADLKAWDLRPDVLQDIVQWSPCEPHRLFPDARVFRLGPEQLTRADWLATLDLEEYSPMGQALIELLKRDSTRDAGELARNVEGGALQGYQQGTLDGLRWRLDSLHSVGLIGAGGISVEELLVGGRTSIFLLRDLPDSQRALVASVLARLLESAMSGFHQSLRVARRHHRDFEDSNLPKRLCIVLDEAHVIAPNTDRTFASSALVDYAKRGRDAGLALIFATQQPAAVDSKLISQADLTITHALSFDTDIQAAIKRMPSDSSPRYTTAARRNEMPLNSTIRSLAPGEAIIADSASNRIFIQVTRPRLTAHGGNVPA